MEFHMKKMNILIKCSSFPCLKYSWLAEAAKWVFWAAFTGILLQQ